jgi:hypothetical protein
MNNIPNFTANWYSQIAKYYFVNIAGRKCRKYLIKCNPTIKNLGMFITSFIPWVNRWVVNRSNILHSKSDYRNTSPVMMRTGIWNHQDRTDMRDITFLMVACYDHPERMENFVLILRWFAKNFDTNISICEMNGAYFRGLTPRYMRIDAASFVRPYMFNELIKASETEINFLWDSDIYIDPQQIIKAVELLRSGKSFVYPYSGPLYYIPRKYYDCLKKTLNVGCIKDPVPIGECTYGGAFGFRKSEYLKLGLENENLSGYVPDDIERLERIGRLARYEMIPGELYHLEHYRGPDSRLGNPSMVKNYLEVFKEKKMTDNELREYIKTWTWAK